LFYEKNLDFSKIFIIFAKKNMVTLNEVGKYSIKKKDNKKTIVEDNIILFDSLLFVYNVHHFIFFSTMDLNHHVLDSKTGNFFDNLDFNFGENISINKKVIKLNPNMNIVDDILIEKNKGILLYNKKYFCYKDELIVFV
jgi:hypothetical protein